ncbi:TetR/AcrR family transcriptional regulator [Actinomadura terrae]|uniref:TetR/AcrR family transcriptional regulator n=1 Tax=Actinomadura terrae TaxID=604353 RepID=UPI001FA7755B|nr:TetR/AcrR family transcriptional regulator [Actinomadura terrae]
MTTSTREPARDRILRTATDLFYVYGIRGVGVDRIIAESGVAKATLYAHFKSKDDLVLTFLRYSDEKWRQMLREAAESAGDHPREQLVGMFGAIEAAAQGGGQFRGCVFINSATESLPGTPVHEATVAHKRAVRAWVAELAAAAGAADPELLARELTILLDGAMAGAALESIAATVPATRQAARAIVDRHL